MKRGEPKKPSGAQFRKRRRKAEARARKLMAEELASGRIKNSVDRYSACGAPSDDALANISYGNRCIAALLHTVMVDPEIDEATRRKEARSLVQALGLTAVKALYEERLEDLMAKVYGKRSQDDRPRDGLEERDS